jgi:hypothetical protein
MKANDIVINERELLNTKIYNPEFDSIKSIPCTMVLRLMDTEEYGCDYCGALNLVLEEFYKLKYCSTVVYMVPRA